MESSQLWTQSFRVFEKWFNFKERIHPYFNFPRYE